MAGGDWPKRARAALVELCISEDEDDALGTKVLIAIRDVFNPVAEDGMQRNRLNGFLSKELLEGLINMETTRLGRSGGKTICETRRCADRRRNLRDSSNHFGSNRA